MHTPTPDPRPARKAGGLRRGVPAAVVLALSMPAAAHPMSLNELLRMPLEQLLQLQVTPAKLLPLHAMPPGKRGG